MSRTPIPRNVRIAVIAAVGVPVLAVVLAALVFGFTRLTSRGQVLRNVSVEGVELSGLDEDGARRALATLEAALAAEPALFTVEGSEFLLLPAEVGFNIDEDAVVADAMSRGRTGNWLSQFAWWFGHARGEEDVLELPISIDASTIGTIVARWEEQAIDARPYNGGLVVANGRAEPDYPRVGRAVDLPAAEQLVRQTMSTLERLPTDLPVVDVSPTLTMADVDAAVTEANLILGGPVVLSRDNPEVSVTFTAEQLAAAFRFEVESNSPAKIDMWLDESVIAGILDPMRSQLEIPPRNAEFRVNADDTVTLLPGHSGTVVDTSAATAELFAAAHRPNRVGEFPFDEGVEPEFTTEEAEAMMPITLVSEFTTKHNCCEPRVANIQLFADLVDDMVVQPGEVFSLNEAVGRRTRDKGFVPAPMIEQGELVPDVGGGVSQFATTFYNAVFFGGYEDVEHSPHSIYISRYPEGREATISWPSPDLKFRNNTDAVVIIKTEHTDTSITVKFFGNNGGIEVSAGLGDRFSFTDAVVRYEGDTSIEPGSEIVHQGGSGGWSVVVTRTIKYPDGRPDLEEQWTVRYRGAARILHVHPCDIPAGRPGHTGQACPSPIPPLGGLTAAEAQARVEAAGFVFALGEPMEVTIESGLNGLVASHTSGFAPAGSTVTVRLGVAPAAPTTTTTVPPSTTTTVAGSATTTTVPPPTTAPPTTTVPPTTVPPTTVPPTTVPPDPDD